MILSLFRSKYILFLFCWALASYSLFAQSQLYVSPNGQDFADGSIRRPLKTIQRAIDKASLLLTDSKNLSDSCEIILREGVYELDSTLEVHVSRLRIASYQGENVIVSGGRRIGMKHLHRVTDSSVRERLQPAAAAHVRELDLKRLGIPMTDLHAVGFGRPNEASWTELFADGVKMRIARWPNDSTQLIGNVYEAGSGEYSKDAPLPVFGYTGDRPLHWKNTDNMWISGYFAHGYADDMIRVARVDTIKRAIHLAQQTLYGFMTGAPWRQWFALNLVEVLDMSGEYVLDVKRGKIYVYLPNTNIAELNVSCVEGPLMAIERCNNVTVDGITFAYGRNIGVYMENTHKVVLRHCVIRDLGGVGVCIGRGSLLPGNTHANSFGGRPCSRLVGDLLGKVYEDVLYNRQGGTQNGVVDCHIHRVGAGGVSLGGGDRRTLTPAGNYVSNCRIHDYNRVECD